MTAPSIKEAFDEWFASNYGWLGVGDQLLKSDMKQAWDAALATFQPDGERREAIARLIGGFPTHPHDGDEQYVLHDAFPGDYDSRTAKIYELVDSLLASGLVQDEAGIRADEREKFEKVCDDQIEFEIKNFEKITKDEKLSEGSKARARDISDYAILVCQNISDSIRSARDGGAS